MFTKTLKFGTYDYKQVTKLQNLLEERGYGDFIPTGFFGIKTLGAVKQFQKDNNLPVTGNVGYYTQGRLSVPKCSNRDYLYQVAMRFIGTDASPNDLAPDELACAETVDAIYYESFGIYINGTEYPEISTYRMYQTLNSSPRFIRVDKPERGDIIMSPTGYGNGKISNGHVGIMASDKLIMSNSSYDSNGNISGRFEQNYTLTEWIKRYRDRGGYPVVFFRVV